MTSWQTLFPNCRVKQDNQDSILLNWHDLLCGVRWQPKPHNWIVVVYDLVEDNELDTAPCIHDVAPTREAAIELMDTLAHKMLSLRVN